jgi:tRNA dimethylallyltransferase
LAELRSNQTAARAIGYRQLLEFFDAKVDLANTIEAVKIKTRQFAKRQRTWFKNQMHVEWILLDNSSNAVEIARKIELDYSRAASESPGGQL